MKYALIVALVVLPSALASGQDDASCKAYFQVLWAKAGTPGLRVGLDASQQGWWESEGHKKYAGLCLNGSVTSSDKPRFLVILSNSKSIGPTPGISTVVYGQKFSDLRGTAPKEWIYHPRWNVASVTILTISYTGGLELPPVYLAPGKLALRVMWPDSAKALEAAVKYLVQEPVFSANASGGRSASN
jgi:hypothetical protein